MSLRKPPPDPSQPQNIEDALTDVSKSIRRAIFQKFPEMTAEEKEDLEQDVKLKMFRLLSDGKKIVHLKSYIWKIVFTTALDIIAKRMKNSTPLEVEGNHGASLLAWAEEACPQALMEKSEKLVAVRRAVDSLPRRRKAVLLLHISGMKREEIAAHLGWSENTVRHLLYRGIEDVGKGVEKSIGRRSEAREPGGGKAGDKEQP